MTVWLYAAENNSRRDRATLFNGCARTVCRNTSPAAASLAALPPSLPLPPPNPSAAANCGGFRPVAPPDSTTLGTCCLLAAQPHTLGLGASWSTQCRHHDLFRQTGPGGSLLLQRQQEPARAVPHPPNGPQGRLVRCELFPSTMLPTIALAGQSPLATSHSHLPWVLWRVCAERACTSSARRGISAPSRRKTSSICCAATWRTPQWSKCPPSLVRAVSMVGRRRPSRVGTVLLLRRVGGTRASCRPLLGLRLTGDPSCCPRCHLSRPCNARLRSRCQQRASLSPS